MDSRYRTDLQEEICQKYNTLNTMPSPKGVIGVSDNISDESLGPIHGLRHLATDTTTGWYIWRGEYSEDDKFFKPTHLEHLLDDCPAVIPYLALPSGWRFLVNPADGYEDVWCEDSLLEV